MNCDLCKLVQGNVVTRKYYEDNKWIIVDCKTCNIPMIVYKEHIMIPKIQHRWQVEELFKQHVNVNHAVFFIDERMKCIPDHYHCHYRRK